MILLKLFFTILLLIISCDNNSDLSYPKSNKAKNNLETSKSTNKIANNINAVNYDNNVNKNNDKIPNKNDVSKTSPEEAVLDNSKGEFLPPPPPPLGVGYYNQPDYYPELDDDDNCTCNDNISCTLDYCGENRSCIFIPDNDLCSDGIFCDGIEICDPQNGCLPGVYPCDDYIPCTIDTCDEVSKTCEHTPDNSLCLGDFCHIDGICDVELGGCIYGINLCDDGIPCTIDTCDNTEHSCIHTPDNSLCPAGDFCQGAGVCDAESGCAFAGNSCDDGIACTIDTCDEQLEACVHTPDNSLCPAGDFCEGAGVCDAQSGCGFVGNSCDDGIACTIDTCDTETQSCVHTPDNSLCPAGDFCEGAGVCDAESGCAFAGNSCDDGIACTIDTCDTETQSCVHTPDNSLCPAGDFCEGAGVCDAESGCGFVGNSCDDGIACTDDSCDTQTGCENTPDNSICSTDPTTLCAGYYCDPSMGGCSNHTLGPCDDQVACTQDLCGVDEDYNFICVHNPDDNLCFINVCFQSSCEDYATCTPPCSGCTPATPRDCDDGIACTIDTCDPTTPNGCVNTPDNSLCTQRPSSDTNCVTTCSISDGCVTPCDDGISCTYDQCNEDGSCSNYVQDCSVDPTCSQGQICFGPCSCDGGTIEQGACLGGECETVCPCN
jgi:hypothetical protein